MRKSVTQTTRVSVRVFIYLPVLLLLTACGTIRSVDYSISPPKDLRSEIVVQKNFEWDTPKVVSVGDVALSVGTFQEEKSYQQFVVPDRSFVAGFFNVDGYKHFSGVKGRFYPVIGTAKLNGKEFLIVQFDVEPNPFDRGPEKIKALVSSNMSIHDQLITSRVSGSILEMAGPATLWPNKVNVDPSGTRLELVEREVTDKYPIENQNNFILVYNGSDERNHHFSYANLEDGNPVPSDRYQQVVFSRSSPLISFRGLLINILRAENSYIEFEVLTSLEVKEEKREKPEVAI